MDVAVVLDLLRGEGAFRAWQVGFITSVPDLVVELVVVPLVGNFVDSLGLDLLGSFGLAIVGQCFGIPR
ncbi:hypothetical protein ACFR9U_14340 [Halorientalis brevis]|uniref:MFS transporter n=1 Tax=Halorientalis brevis TaxID=1126241 RepID=A0ABD6CDS9_9EURY|nr:hypothetical protein [Halorientalis brevis]